MYVVFERSNINKTMTNITRPTIKENWLKNKEIIAYNTCILYC